MVWFYKAPVYHGLRVVEKGKLVCLWRKSQKPTVRVAETFLLALPLADLVFPGRFGFPDVYK